MQAYEMQNFGKNQHGRKDILEIRFLKTMLENPNLKKIVLENLKTEYFVRHRDCAGGLGTAYYGLFIFSDVYRLWSSVLVFLSAAAQIVSGHEGLAQGILKFFVMLSALLRGGRSIMKGLNRGYLYVLWGRAVSFAFSGSFAPSLSGRTSLLLSSGCAVTGPSVGAGT